MSTSTTATPRTVTQYPHSDPAVITAPLNMPVAFDTLLQNAVTIANLQSQITSLEARVAALEAARTA